MTLEELVDMLESITGFSGKVAFRAFPEGDAPDLPFICYTTPESDNFAADGVAYVLFTRVNIELYTRYKSPADEALVETAIYNNGLYWDKYEDYIPEEKMYMTTYEIEV